MTATTTTTPIWHTPSVVESTEPLDGVAAHPPAELVEEGRQLLADALELAVQAHDLAVRLGALWERITAQRPVDDGPLDDAYADMWNYGTHSLAASTVMAIAARYLEDAVGGSVSELPHSPRELRLAYAEQIA